MTTRVLILAVALGALNGCVGMEVTSGNVALSDSKAETGIVLTDNERETIARYYRGHVLSKVPAGRGSLSSGLVKRDEVPRSVRIKRLPAPLEKQLRVLPDGYIRAIIGGDIILINRRTRVVMDIYRDIVR